MAVERRADSKYWYGRWQVDGIRHSVNLKIPVRGKPGSEAFAKSKQQAEDALAKVKKDAAVSAQPEETLRKIHKIRHGDKVGRIAIGRLPDEWLALPRRRDISKGRITYATRVLKHFVSYIRSNYPRAKELADITPSMAQAYMKKIEKEGVSGRTYNAALSLLKGTFEHIRVKAGMLTNPFKEGLVTKDENSIHRQPFSMEELDHLLNTAAKHDEEIHGLIVLGACTALRLGDAACLKWEDVDLPNNRIRVSTNKTGNTALLPIFPRLRVVLESKRRSGKWVFPELAELYTEKRWELTKRVNEVFTQAGFSSVPKVKVKNSAKIIEVDLPENEEAMRKEVLTKIDALGPEYVSPRVKGTMREVYDLYSSGCTIPDIVKELGISQGSASTYLTRIKKVAGHPIVRKEVKQIRDAQSAASLESVPAPERNDGKGKIRINNRGFHALRATFATQALAAGIPIEMVKIITGHSLTQTVVKHYFNPDEELVLDRMQKAMPPELTLLASKTPKEQILDILDNTSGKKWKRDAEQIKALMGEV